MASSKIFVENKSKFYLPVVEYASAAFLFTQTHVNTVHASNVFQLPANIVRIAVTLLAYNNSTFPNVDQDHTAKKKEKSKTLFKVSTDMLQRNLLTQQSCTSNQCTVAMLRSNFRNIFGHPSRGP